MNLFENVINEKALDNLTAEQLDVVLKVLEKAGC